MTVVVNPVAIPLIDIEAHPVDPVTQRLLEAADDIEQNGLAKDAWEDERGRHCIVGAIGKTDEYLHTDIDEVAWGAVYRVAEVLGFEGADLDDQLQAWNDRTRRRKADVVTVLRKAALGG